jgi:hypothetical protein
MASSTSSKNAPEGNSALSGASTSCGGENNQAVYLAAGSARAGPHPRTHAQSGRVHVEAADVAAKFEELFGFTDDCMIVSAPIFNEPSVSAPMLSEHFVSVSMLSEPFVSVSMRRQQNVLLSPALPPAEDTRRVSPQPSLSLSRATTSCGIIVLAVGCVCGLCRVRRGSRGVLPPLSLSLSLSRSLSLSLSQSHILEAIKIGHNRWHSSY